MLQFYGGAVMEGGEVANNGRRFYLDNIAIHIGGVSSALDGAIRLAIILDRHLGMNGVMNAWPSGVDEKVFDSARKYESQLLKRIEPVLQEQLARAKTIAEPNRTSMEGLWLELIGAGHLSGQRIVDGLKTGRRQGHADANDAINGRRRLH